MGAGFKYGVLMMDIYNLKLRIYTSLVLLPLVFFPIYMGGWYFSLGLVLFVTVLFYELITISDQQKKETLSVLYFLSLLLIIISWDIIWIMVIILLVLMSFGSLCNLLILKKIIFGLSTFSIIHFYFLSFFTH